MVTHVSHCFGNKVSIWTDTGTLLASVSYTSSAGTWTETALATPLQLHAGTKYRVATYTGGIGNAYYWRSDMDNAFPDGTIDTSYQRSGDSFPTTSDNVRWWFVGLRYNVGLPAPIAISPSSTTFSGGVWAGSVTVHDTATGMYLRADDGNGHKVDSATFDVAPAPLDFGDAPATYPTSTADNGARHILVPGFHLGGAADAESDGQPSADATFDDAAGTPDDEDGVTFATPFHLGRDAAIEVTASAAGKLDAWIDFNNDGDWDDPGEKVFDNIGLVSGPNTLTIAVPVTATLTDQTFARFRFSSAGRPRADWRRVGRRGRGLRAGHRVGAAGSRRGTGRDGRHGKRGVVVGGAWRHRVLRPIRQQRGLLVPRVQQWLDSRHELHVRRTHRRRVVLLSRPGQKDGPRPNRLVDPKPAKPTSAATR